MFYDKYSQLCTNKGIAETKAAIEAGISKSLVTKWKNNRTAVPSTEVLKKLSVYFNIPVSVLLEEEKPTVTGEQKEIPDQPELTEEDRELLEILKLIPADAKRNFLEMGRLYAASLRKD